jgi:hypothetical protein
LVFNLNLNFDFNLNLNPKPKNRSAGAAVGRGEAGRGALFLRGLGGFFRGGGSGFFALQVSDATFLFDDFVVLFAHELKGVKGGE